MRKLRNIKFALAIFTFFLGGQLQAQEVADTLHVERAGTLPALIKASDKELINTLTVTGNINGTDIKYIREMGGRSSAGEATNGVLSVLDLSGAHIVEGGDPYLIAEGDTCYTENEMLGKNMFSNCEKLVYVTLPKSIIAIGASAFAECSSLKSINIPDGVTFVEENAFGCCTRLASVTIPSSVDFIGKFAFLFCPRLTTVTIQEGVTFIGEGAFENCKGLASITIPSSVAFIGEDAFSGCLKLSSLSIPQGTVLLGNVK